MRGTAFCCVTLMIIAGCSSGDGLHASDARDDDDSDTAFEGADASAEPAPPEEAGSGQDAGTTANEDPGVPSDGLNAGFSSRGDSDDVEATPDAAESAGDPSTCFDGIDNDSSAALDCNDPNCQGLASCCIGHGDCCEPLVSPPVPASLSFSACDGFAVDACLSDVVAFGPIDSATNAGYLAPRGNELYDSGLVVGDAIDLTQHRLAITTTFQQATGCGVTCLESAAMGVTTQASLDDTSTVRPLVALLMSGSRDDVSLVVADEIVAAWPMAASYEQWSLIVRATGTISVVRDGVDLGTDATFVPSAGARLVVYGRGRETVPASENARVGTVTAQVELCDIPDAWGSTAGALTLTRESMPASFDFASEPSRASNGSATWLAFEAGDGVYLASETSAHTYALTTAVGTPAFAGMLDYDSERTGAPSLVYRGSNWYLYYTAESAAGTLSIGRAVALDPMTGFVRDAEPVLAPSAVASVTAFESPSVAIAPDGSWIMVVRTTLTDGTRGLMSLYSFDGREWTPIDGDGLDEVSRTAAMADEIASPSLVIHNRAWNVYFAARNGTRWSIAMVASDELLFFRSLGTVFGGGSGEFDRLGASAPSVDLDGGEVRLLYAGHDGARTRLSYRSRQGAEAATF